MLRFPLVLALLTLPAAALGDPLPQHILWNIQLTVRSADAVALATVSEVKGARGKPRTVVLEIARQLAGELPLEVEVPARGFDVGDLVPGTQLLVALRRRPADLGWVSTGRYELFADGKIREYDLEVYAAQTVLAFEASRALFAQRTRARSHGLREVPRPARRSRILSQTRPCQNFTPANGC